MTTARARPLVRYLAMAGGVTGLVLAAAFLFPAGTRRTGVLVAAGVALGVQIVAFGLVLRYRSRPNGFLAAWLGGSMLRLLALGGTAAVVWRGDALDPLWTLLGLAGLFFVLHLLEPLALRGADPEPETETGTESG